MTSKELIADMLTNGSNDQKLSLFAFDSTTPVERIYKKYKIFGKTLFPRYFKQKSAPFHKEMLINYILSYRGKKVMELDFRGAGKTTQLKIFMTFVLLNDLDKSRKYIKVLTKDGKNSQQSVTDIYNLMVELMWLYGDQFKKEGDKKREETRKSFTMKDDRKLTAGTIGQTQRGHVQDAYRPDWIWFDDVEDRSSIASQVQTRNIISAADEALTGLDKDGSYVLTGNYISEDGVVEWFKKRAETVHVVPIKQGETPTWDIYSMEDIAELERTAEDFWGEYMQDPSRSENKFFDMDRLARDIEKAREPKRVSAGIKYFEEYIPHHRYGIGCDTSEGIGLDSNTLANFDFSTGELVTTYYNNKIAPDLFGYEAVKVGNEYGTCILAIERNNTGHATIATAKDYTNLYYSRTVEGNLEKITDKIGWSTNSRTKTKMFFDFRKDYNDGLIRIYDVDALKEMRAYTNTDLSVSTGVTRHFDLLTSCVIAWQMKNYATDPVSSFSNTVRMNTAQRQRSSAL